MKRDLDFKIIDNVNDFFDIKEKWLELFENIENKEIFYSWEWIETYVKVIKRSNFNPYIIIAEEKGTVVSIVPFCIEISKIGLLNKRVLKFIVQDTADYQCILIRKDYNHYSILKKLFKEIINSDKWDIIKLNNISSNENQAILIKEVLQLYYNNIKCYKDVNKIAPFIKLDDFEIKKNYKRYNALRKKENQINKDSRVQFYIDSGWNTEVWKSLVEIHKNYWNESILKNIRYVEFYEKLYYRLNNTEKLELSYVTYEKMVVAGHIGFKLGNKIYSYNSFNSEIGQKFGMGSILDKKIIEYYKDIYEVFDLLMGNEEYKFYYTDAAISIYDYTIIRNNDVLLRLGKAIKSCNK